jgi:hypothetical protein
MAQSLIINQYSVLDHTAPFGLEKAKPISNRLADIKKLEATRHLFVGGLWRISMGGI